VITVTQQQHPFHYYRSPAEIREIQFSHRVRGLDEYEVSEFLDLLADQCQATDLELDRLRDERDRLRQEVDRLRTEREQVAAQPAHHDPASMPQAATLLMNAQRVADDLVEEAVRRTRDMLTVARAEKNAILRNARETAAAMLAEARDSRPAFQGAAEDGRSDTPLAREVRSRQASASPARSYPSGDTASESHISAQRTWQLDGHAAV
jgi:DivIVA domain-containing protein